MDKSCHQYALWLGLCGYKYISLGGQLVINYDCLSLILRLIYQSFIDYVSLSTVSVIGSNTLPNV